MDIEVRLFATFRDYLPAGSAGFAYKKALNGQTTVQDVIDELKLPANIPKIIIVNGRHSNQDYVLADGDILSIFPPVAGG